MEPLKFGHDAFHVSLDAQVLLRSTYSMTLTAPPTVVDQQTATATIQLTGRGGKPVSISRLKNQPTLNVTAKQGTQELPVRLSAVSPDGRAGIGETIAAQWLETDPVAARAWLTKAPLPDEVKQRLLSQSPSPPPLLSEDWVMHVRNRWPFSSR